MVSAERKVNHARQSLREAEQFLGITQKQEQGGEVAHADVVKAQIQSEQRRRDAQEAQLAVEKARIGLAVLIFPDFRQDFSVVDDLETAGTLPPFPRDPGSGRQEQSRDSRRPGNRAAADLRRQSRSRRAVPYAVFRLLLRDQRQAVRHPQP